MNVHRRQSVLTANDANFKVVPPKQKLKKRRRPQQQQQDVPAPLQTSSTIEVSPQKFHTEKVKSSSVGTIKRGKKNQKQQERRRQKPENKLLSYSLSVMDRPKPADIVAKDWTLYRPEEPGNSPIYIATQMQGPEEKEEEELESISAPPPQPQRQESYFSRRQPPVSFFNQPVKNKAREPQRQEKKKPSSSENNNRWQRPVSSYDPFNPPAASPDVFTGGGSGNTYFSRRNGAAFEGSSSDKSFGRHYFPTST